MVVGAQQVGGAALGACVTGGYVGVVAVVQADAVALRAKVGERVLHIGMRRVGACVAHHEQQEPCRKIVHQIGAPAKRHVGHRFTRSHTSAAKGGVVVCGRVDCARIQR